MSLGARAKVRKARNVGLRLWLFGGGWGGSIVGSSFAHPDAHRSGCLLCTGVLHNCLHACLFLIGTDRPPAGYFLIQLSAPACSGCCAPCAQARQRRCTGCRPPPPGCPTTGWWRWAAWNWSRSSACSRRMHRAIHTQAMPLSWPACSREQASFTARGLHATAECRLLSADRRFLPRRLPFSGKNLRPDGS